MSQSPLRGVNEGGGPGGPAATRRRREAAMRQENLEDSPGRERFPSRSRWDRSEWVRHNCQCRIVRMLRRMVGRPWGEVEQALDRFCRDLPADRELVGQVRRWARERLLD